MDATAFPHLAALLPGLLRQFTIIWEAVRAGPYEPIAWGDWHGFWLSRFFAEHFLVVYCAPLLPVLLLLRGDGLRRGVVVTALLFLTYVFGALYAGLWLLTCLALHAFAERFAIEAQRKDVLQIGPPLAAIGVVGGWYALTMALGKVSMPEAWNTALHANFPWVYPLGARGWDWEPVFVYLWGGAPAGSVPGLFAALFWDVHFVGTAYLAVRMLHYLSEIKRGNLPAAQRTRLNFLAYVCYAPTLIQGPIERFAPFQQAMDTCHAQRCWANVPPALGRITLGLAKNLLAKTYLTQLLWYEFHLGQDNLLWRSPEEIGSFWLLYLSPVLILLKLYLEFSGYCDIAVGCSRLLGFRLVENFDQPWLATSLRDFWRRWHISLSLILRDYVYIALGGNRQRATLNLCLTFFLCGIWHRLILQVGVWGLLMGLMVAVNQGWVDRTKRWDAQPEQGLGRVRRLWLRCAPLPQIAAWLLTMHAFFGSLLIFFGGWGGVRVLGELLRRIVAAGVAFWS